MDGNPETIYRYGDREIKVGGRLGRNGQGRSGRSGKPGKSKPETAGRGKQVKPSGKKGAEAAATEGGDGEPVQQGELF